MLPRGKHNIASAAAPAAGLSRAAFPERSGRADCWVKVKNPAAPAVTREAEEDWN